MSATTPIVIIKALDALSLRAAATAQNIVAANSPHYRPVEVKFEDSLRAAAAKGSDAVRDLAITTTRAAVPAGGDPRVDLELATASDTAGRYGALVELLGREMSIARTVVRGGQ